MQLPPDAGPGRNGLQAIGSSRSYGKRYLACDILNLITEGADDNGNSVGFITDQQYDALLTLMAQCGMDQSVERKAAFLTYMKAKTLAEIQRRDFRKAEEALKAEGRKIRTK